MIKDKWSPASIVCLTIIGTVCINMLMMEAGILLRSDHGDVAESRTLLKDTTTLVVGLAAGYFLGRRAEKRTDDSDNKET